MTNVIGESKGIDIILPNTNINEPININAKLGSKCISILIVSPQ